MEISKETIAVLKNFASINNSISVDEPQCFKTISSAKTVIGVFDTQETFPNFAFYNLTEFLAITSLYKTGDTDFDFKENFVEIKSGRSKLKYGYTEPALIPNIEKLTKSEVYKNFKDFNASFELQAKTIQELSKVSTIMSVPNLQIILKDGSGKIILSDSEDPDSNSWEKEIEGEGDCDISVIASNLVMLPGNYNANIKSGAAIKFTHTEIPLFYFITITK